MNAKFSLAIIALIGIGVFALPSTMSLFAGQHSFYNIDATGNQVPCEKCHGDVKAELGANVASTTTGTPGPHAQMTCEMCHRVETGLSSGDDAFWEIVYRNGTGASTNNKTLVITVFDFERQNYPGALKGAPGVKALKVDPSWNTVQLQTALVTAGGQNFFGYSSSRRPAGYAGVSNGTIAGATNLMSLYETVYVPTYNSTTVGPKDTNSATKNSALSLNLVNTYGGSLTSANWTVVAGIPELNLNGLGSRIINPGQTYHAASLVSCMECHGGEPVTGHETDRQVGPTGTMVCADCHYGNGDSTKGQAGGTYYRLWAGGFDVTTDSTDVGGAEAHTPWVKDQGVSRFAYGANNDACIACHTHVAVDINFKKGYKLELDATASTNTSTGLSGYSIDDARIEGSVYVTTYGNQNGDVWAVSNQKIDWTSSGTNTYQMYDANGPQGLPKILDLNNKSNDQLGSFTP